MKKNKKIILILILLISISAGLYARFHSLNFIYSHKEEYFYDTDKPVLATADGYVYLRYAEDFENGEFKFGGIDEYKNAPENFLNVDDKYKAFYPYILPLNSFLYYLGHKLTGINLDLFSSYLAPILAILVVIPIALLFYRKNLYLTALSGSLISVISYMYVVRTSFARPDTDVLNLFFPFMIVYLSYRFLVEDNLKKIYILSILLGITHLLYYWWYLHPNINLVFFLILIGLVIFTKDNRKELYKPLGIIFIISGIFIYIFGAIKDIFGQIRAYIIVEAPTYEGLDIEFPNVTVAVQELQKFSLSKLSFLTVGNEIILIMGFIGIILFFIKFWRTALLLLPIFLIGLLTFKSGNRFSIYLAPFIGIGFGYILDILINKVREENKLKIFSLAFVSTVLVLLFLNLKSLSFIHKPILPSKEARDFYILRENLPQKAWIWTWWDMGYPIEYIMRKTTYADGSFPNMPKLYFIAKSFTTSDEKETYYLIKTLSYLGTIELIKKLFINKIPLEKISQSLNPKSKRKIYVLYSKDMIGKFIWIGYFGSWDFQKKKGKMMPIISLPLCETTIPNILVCGKTQIDINRGIITNLVTKKTDKLEKFVFSSDNRLVEKPFKENKDAKLVFEIVTRNKKTMFLLMDKDTYKTNFNQMYLLGRYNKNLFDLVYDNFPYTVVYKLKH
jgi:dolichyl-diphosphooligosaccharide--protein glycosyltransferase